MKWLDWKPDDLHALITIPATDCNFKGSLGRATDAELVDAKTYLTRHPEGNKSRLTAVNREIQRRVRKEAKN